MTPFARIKKYFDEIPLEEEDSRELVNYYPKNDVIATYKDSRVNRIVFVDGVIDEIDTEGGTFIGKMGGIPYSSLAEVQIYQKIIE